MADWTLEVDMVTSQLEDALGREQIGGGGTNGGANQQQQESTLAGGFSKGLKFAGIIGILSSLKVVTDSIGFVLGVISSLLGYFIVTFIQNVVTFFQDPVRGLLGLGVWIVNGIVAGLNLVISAINMLIPGTSRDIGLIDTIDSQSVLAEYDRIKEEQRIANENMATVIEGANDVAYNGDIMNKASDNAVKSVTNAMLEIEKAWANLDTSKSKNIYTSGNTQSQSELNYFARMSIDPNIINKKNNTEKMLGMFYRRD